MVAHLLRLKLSILANAARRPRRQLAGMIAGLVGALALTVLAVSVVGWLPTSLPADDAGSVLVVVGSAIVLGFGLLPLAFGADDQLDPGRFAWFGIPAIRLAGAILVAALVSLPVLSLVVILVANTVAWGSFGAAVAALASGALILVTCVLLGRISATVATLVLWRRRAREAAGVVVLVVLAVLAPAVAVLGTLDWGSHALPILRRIGTVLAWTPLGAAWAIPADVAMGDAAAAWGKTGVAALVVVVLALAWFALVVRSMTARRPPETERHYLGLGWFGALPATPFGVVAARSLSYWGRDARYLVALAAVPVIPAIAVIALAIAGVPADIIVWIPVPLMCLFIGWSIHNDVSHDSSAFWLHLSTSTAGLADRWGRIIPPLAIGTAVALGGSVLSAVIVGNWAQLPGLVAVSMCALLCALGVASVASAAAPYAAVHPGDSPFAQPQGSGPNGSSVQFVSLLVPMLLTAPVVWLAVLSVDDPSLVWAVLGAGLGLGAVVIAAGSAWGGAIINRHSPELLEFTLRS